MAAGRSSPCAVAWPGRLLTGGLVRFPPCLTFCNARAVTRQPTRYRHSLETGYRLIAGKTRRAVFGHTHSNPDNFKQKGETRIVRASGQHITKYCERTSPQDLQAKLLKARDLATTESCVALFAKLGGPIPLCVRVVIALTSVDVAAQQQRRILHQLIRGIRCGKTKDNG